MTEPRRIAWGVLSTGAIASTFARDLALLPEEAALVAVGSRDRARAERFATQHGFARAYGSCPELAADPDVDVVYVASVHPDHLASARLCLEAGKPVLVEKPLTVTAAQGEALLGLARRRGLFCMEAVWNRTNPLLRAAAETVRAGELGPVRHLAASFGFAWSGPPTSRLVDPALGAGAILDQGPYPAHAAVLFLGEPATLTASGSWIGTGVDGHAAAVLGYPGLGDRPSATATLVCSLEVDLPTRLEVGCADGSVVVEEFLRPSEMTVRRRGTEPETLVTAVPGRGYTFEAQEVMRCLRAGDIESPLVPWSDTLAALRVLDRWRAALDGGQH